MKRALLLVALAVTAGLVAVEVTSTFAGFTDEEEATGSFTADLCSDGECKIVHAKVDDYDCNDEEWHFVLTSTDEETAPRSIHVTWSEDDAAVGLERVTGKTAHYRTSSYLDASVEEASARVQEDWDGRFNLGEGPC